MLGKGESAVVGEGYSRLVMKERFPEAAAGD